MQETEGTQIWSLGWEDSLEESMETTLVFLPREDMDRGTWWATVHRVTKNRTQLKQLSTYMVREVKQLFLETEVLELYETF